MTATSTDVIIGETTLFTTEVIEGIIPRGEVFLVKWREVLTLVIAIRKAIIEAATKAIVTITTEAPSNNATTLLLLPSNGTITTIVLTTGETTKAAPTIAHQAVRTTAVAAVLLSGAVAVRHLRAVLLNEVVAATLLPAVTPEEVEEDADTALMQPLLKLKNRNKIHTNKTHEKVYCIIFLSLDLPYHSAG